MSTAVVFSEVNILALHLVENLLNNGCVVSIIAHGESVWKKETSHLEENVNLKILNYDQSFPAIPTHVFFISGIGIANTDRYLEQEMLESFQKAFDYLSRLNTKSVLLLPFLQNTFFQTNAVYLSQKFKTEYLLNMTTVYLGELYGTRMQFLDEDPVTRILKDVVFGGVARVPQKDFFVYYSFVGDVVQDVVGKIFSFGFAKKEFALTQTGGIHDFARKLVTLKPATSLVTDNTIAPPKILKISQVEEPAIVKKDSLLKTVEWLSKYAPVPEVKLATKPKPTKVKRVVIKPKYEFTKKNLSLTFVVLVVLFLSSPFITLAASGFLLKASVKKIYEGNIASFEKYVGLTDSLSGYARKSFLVASNIPLLGTVFEFPLDVASTVQLTAQIGKGGAKLTKESTRLVEAVLGTKEVDLDLYSQDLSQGIDQIIKSVDFLNLEIKKLPLPIQSLVPKELNSYEFGKYLNSARDLALRLPVLLGGTKPVTYLVLLQNNMELRPTGGFIGSFALVSFNGGKLTDINVFDVYSADGQLKGHIEPPAPIRDFLGEANWYLRDSNWDPDFPTSAARAEWFLEKSLERSVDGVVGLDLEIVKNILNVTGPLVLADFNQEITSGNMFEKIQYEVESDFFPGSRKKANFLTSLSRTLLTRLTQAKPHEYIGLSKVLLEGLNNRHLQLFLHDAQAQRAISEVGWDGGIDIAGCGTNCTNVFLGLVEANVGVNKANYFVKRKMKLETKPTGENVHNKLTVEYQNTAAPALGLSGRYKNYVRLVVPERSSFARIELVDPGGRKIIEPDLVNIAGRLEAGALIEVGPAQTKQLVFEWDQTTSLNFGRKGKIMITWRKEPGTVADPIEAKIALPVEVTDPTGYTTNLSRDFIKEISWGER